VLKTAALLFALLLTLAGLFAWVQLLPAQYGGSIMGTTAHKIDLLKNTSGPRLILAGGSSSPYATDCESIGGALGVNCINVGVTAYFGMEFYLSLLEKTMRPGDTIVLAPEHSMLSGNIAYSTLWMGLENHPEVWAMEPPGAWPHLAAAYPAYAVDKVRMHLEEADWASHTYHEDFGPLGNVVAPRETRLEAGWWREDPIALSAATLSPDVANQLNAFYEKAAAADVTVYLAFAPLDKLALTTPEADWWALEAAMRDAIKMPILGSLADALMDGPYFYDSNNHLTTQGAALYSERLVALLRQTQSP
jgi:hypothetical protein